MDSHVKLMCYSTVRWLSRGQIVSCLFKLRNEIQYFQIENNSPLANNYVDVKVLKADWHFFSSESVTFLSSRQNSSIFHVSDKTEGSMEKLSLWANVCSGGKDGNISTFK